MDWKVLGYVVWETVKYPLFVVASVVIAVGLMAMLSTIVGPGWAAIIALGLIVFVITSIYIAGEYARIMVLKKQGRW